MKFETHEQRAQIIEIVNSNLIKVYIDNKQHKGTLSGARLDFPVIEVDKINFQISWSLAARIAQNKNTIVYY